MSRLVDRYTSRRGFLQSLAMSVTAVAFAPAYVVRPITAQSAIISCLGLRCHWKSPCCDRWTAFCCAVTGENVCPPGTVVGGWWKVDNSEFCSIDRPRPRYYIDCNLACHGEHRCGRRGMCPSSATSARCRCHDGCESQRVDCVAVSVRSMQPGHLCRSDSLPGRDLCSTLAMGSGVQPLTGADQRSDPPPGLALPARRVH